MSGFSLKILFLKVIHVVCFVDHHFNYCLVFYPTVDGHLGKSQFVVLINSATVNILELVFWGAYNTHISVVFIPRNEIVES